MPVKKAAVVDIGSNSVRLVIYDVQGTSALPTFNEKVMAGLGKGVIETGKLSVEGWASALKALKRYRAILKALGVTSIAATATAAVRVATDGPAFVKDASKALGTPIQVLSGADEARLSALGVSAGASGSAGMVGDLGGSSLELQALGKRARLGESLLLGPLSLMQDGFDLATLRKRVRAALKTSATLSTFEGTLYVVGGAFRSMAKISMAEEDYGLKVLQGYRLNARQIAHCAKLCIDSQSNARARAFLEAHDRRRGPLLPYAAVVLEQMVELAGTDSVTISSFGLREGVLRELCGTGKGDPLLDGAIAFARLDEGQAAFGRALYEFVKPAFRPEKDLFGSAVADARIDQAACLMADSAGRFHPDHRSQMAYEQALRAPYAGVTHAQRAMIAHAVGCRYSRKFRRPEEYLALNSDAESTRARQLGSAMRLGAVFSGRSGPILRRATLARDKNALILRVKSGSEAMISATVERRLSQTASLMQLKPDVVFD